VVTGTVVVVVVVVVTLGQRGQPQVAFGPALRKKVNL
jgi:hypothetical protein